MNRRLSLGVAASVAVLSIATVAVAQTTPDTTWTGPYIGANIGGAWGSSAPRLSAITLPNGAVVIPPGDVNTIVGAAPGRNSSGGGFTIGLEGGYNHEFDNHLVLGIETDATYLDNRQSRTRTFQSAVLINPPVTYTIGQDVHTDWQWTLRPRLGYAWGPWLAYLTGGLGVTDVRVLTSYTDTHTPPNAFSFSSTKTRAGGVVGVGGAWMFMPGWSAKLEYLYSDYGHVSETLPVGNVALTSSAKVNLNTVRLGFDYKF